jgi:hypothetical protein
VKSRPLGRLFLRLARIRQNYGRFIVARLCPLAWQGIPPILKGRFLYRCFKSIFASRNFEFGKTSPASTTGVGHRKK